MLEAINMYVVTKIDLLMFFAVISLSENTNINNKFIIAIKQEEFLWIFQQTFSHTLFHV